MTNMMVMRHSQGKLEWHWRTEEMAAAAAPLQTWREIDSKCAFIFFLQSAVAWTVVPVNIVSFKIYIVQNSTDNVFLSLAHH